MSNWPNNDDSSKSDSVDSDFEKPPAAKFDVDSLIKQLLSPKVRNAGILTDL